MKKLILTLVIFTFTLLTNAAEIANPGAESGTSTPDNWTAAGLGAGDSATWDSAEAHGGSKSLKIINASGNSVTWQSDVVTSVPSQGCRSVILKAWSKADNVAAGAVYKLNAKITYTNGSSQWISTNLSFNTGTHDWEQVSYLFEHSWKRIRSVEAHLTLDGTGTVWFDDITASTIDGIEGNINVFFSGEEGTGTAPKGWYAYKSGGEIMERDSAEAYSYEDSFKSINTLAGTTRWTRSATISSPTKKLRFTAAAKGENVSALADFSVVFNVTFTDNTTDMAVYEFPEGTSGWNYIDEEVFFPKAVKQVSFNMYLNYGTGTAWFDHICAAPLDDTAAVISTPADTSALTANTAAFSWNDVAADSYILQVGTSFGGSDIRSIEVPGSQTSVTLSDLPVDGSTVYVRLNTRFGTSSLNYSDTSYTAANISSAAIYQPSTGSVLSTTSQTFNWIDTGADSYQLTIGTTQGASDIHDSGSITDRFATVAGLASASNEYWVRISTTTGASTTFLDYRYFTAAATTAVESPARIHTPYSGDQFYNTTAQFIWNDTGADSYSVYAGLTPGSKGYGELNNTTGTEATFINLPTDGSTLYVTLFSHFPTHTSVTTATYTCKFEGIANGNSEIDNGSGAPQGWGGNPPHTEWATDEYVTGSHSYKIINTGGTILWWNGARILDTQSKRIRLGAWCKGLNIDPAAEVYVFIRAWDINGVEHNGQLNFGTGTYGWTWGTANFDFPEKIESVGVQLRVKSGTGTAWFDDITAEALPDTPATMLVPAIAQFDSPSVNFQWSNAQADAYELLVGTTQGASDLQVVSAGTANSRTVANLPIDGSTVWVRLRTNFGGTWYHNDYSYQSTSDPAFGSIFEQVFAHDGVNRRSTVDLNDGSQWAYQYGSKGNLQSAVKAHGSDPQQDKTFTYNFDDIGNRTTATEDTVAKTYTANDLNQYSAINVGGTVENITFDDAGNPQTKGDWDLTWDGEDRLKTMENTITGEKLEFEYDFRGFRVWKKVYLNAVLQSWTGYLYDGRLVSQEIDLMNSQKVKRSYTWGLDPAGTKQEVGGIGALLSMEETQPDDSTKDYQYLNDAGGNVVKVLNADDLTVANEYEYGPFGQTIAKNETVTNPYQYNTKYYDEETGLLYYGYRFYDADNGRWVNRDPISYAGGINVYNSVSNNMVNGYDQSIALSGGMKSIRGELIEGVVTNSTSLDPYGHAGVDYYPHNKPTPKTQFDYRPWVKLKVWFGQYNNHESPKNRAGGGNIIDGDPTFTLLKTDPKPNTTLRVLATRPKCGILLWFDAIPLAGVGKDITIPSTGEDAYADIRKPDKSIKGALPFEIQDFGYVDLRDNLYKSYYQPIISDGKKNASLWWGKRGSKWGGASSNIETRVSYPHGLYGADWYFVTKNQTKDFTISLKGPTRVKKYGFGGGLRYPYMHNTGGVFLQEITKFKIQFIFPKK